MIIIAGEERMGDRRGGLLNRLTAPFRRTSAQALGAETPTTNATAGPSPPVRDTKSSHAPSPKVLTIKVPDEMSTIHSSASAREPAPTKPHSRAKPSRALPKIPKVGTVSEGDALKHVLRYAQSLLALEPSPTLNTGSKPLAPEAALDIEKRQELGRSANATSKSEAGIQDIHLGIDFGSSCIKCAALFPYQAGEPVIAVPAPEGLWQEDHAYLWPSAVWLSPDTVGSFSLYDRGDDVSISGIKNRLIVAPDEDDGSGVTPTVVATALLTLHLRQVKGHLLRSYPAYFDVPRAEWTVNFGYPASSLDDDEVAMRFKRCCAAALELDRSGETVSIQTVTQAIESVYSSFEAVFEDLGSGVVPEMTAAVSGFAHAGRFEDGLFGLIDVGGMTVDCCTFNLNQEDTGDIKCPIFVADVQPLGVEIMRLWREAGGLQRHFKQAVQCMAQMAIWTTKRNRYPTSPRWKSGLPVFVIGGGIASKVHKEAAANLDAWYRSVTNASDGGGIEVMELTPPDNLQHESCSDVQAQRLLVAVGLARPQEEILRVTLPQEIEDMPGKKSWFDESRYTGKEMV